MRRADYAREDLLADVESGPWYERVWLPLLRLVHRRALPAHGTHGHVPPPGPPRTYRVEVRLPGATSASALLAWREVLDDLPGLERVGPAPLLSGEREVAVFCRLRSTSGAIAERRAVRELQRRGYLVEAVRSRPA
jgi:hypothetical protein